MKLTLPRKIPAVFMRGGTSKGIVFHRAHLPQDQKTWDPLFLALLGSPDPNGRQLNGMGGGISSLSKICIVGPSTRSDADVDYTFAQVAVRQPIVDYSGTCGNMSSAIGPFAVDEGLVGYTEPQASVRIHNTNTGKIIVSHFSTAEGRTLEEGDFGIPGVAGGAAPIRLAFLDPAGASTGRLLPSGSVVDELGIPGFGKIEASLIDSSAACVLIDAASLGLSARESPSELGNNKDLMNLLEQIRLAGSLRMGIAQNMEEARRRVSIPFTAIVAAPSNSRLLSGDLLSSDDCDLLVRLISVGQPHLAVPVTAALCIGVASCIEGSVVHRVARRTDKLSQALRVGHPSGVTTVEAQVARCGNSQWRVQEAVVWRTARRLMEGAVWVPSNG